MDLAVAYAGRPVLRAAAALPPQRYRDDGRGVTL